MRWPRHVWAVAAIHGDAARLVALHQRLDALFQPGDRLVYLGNLIGRGPAVAQTLDEVVDFRRRLLARPGIRPHDIVYLRGGQEEMWQALPHVPLAPDPDAVLAWLLEQGLAGSLAAYGTDEAEARRVMRQGGPHLATWLRAVGAALERAPGHQALFHGLSRAAFTTPPRPSLEVEAAGDAEAAGAAGVLLVSAGLDVRRGLEDQGDAFWWGGADFGRIDRPYGGFARLVRGYDPSHNGVVVSAVTVTLDGGCGFGGPLVAGCFSPKGDLLERLTV